jgi:hypothetical protein
MRPPAAAVIRPGAPFLPPPLFNPFPNPTFAAQLAATTNGWPSPVFPAPAFNGLWNNGAIGGGLPFGGSFPWFDGAGGFSGGGLSGGGGNFAPPVSNAPQPGNLTVMMPQRVVPPPMMRPMGAPALETPAAATAPAERPAPTEFPALIATKDGWTYSATTYWTKGATFHFITTKGEHLQVPVNRLARVYPPQQGGQSIAPDPPPQQ